MFKLKVHAWKYLKALAGLEKIESLDTIPRVGNHLKNYSFREIYNDSV